MVLRVSSPSPSLLTRENFVAGHQRLLQPAHCHGTLGLCSAAEEQGAAGGE